MESCKKIITKEMTKNVEEKMMAEEIEMPSDNVQATLLFVDASKEFYLQTLINKKLRKQGWNL